MIVIELIGHSKHSTKLFFMLQQHFQLRRLQLAQLVKHSQLIEQQRRKIILPLMRSIQRFFRLLPQC